LLKKVDMGKRLLMGLVQVLMIRGVRVGIVGSFLWAG